MALGTTAHPADVLDRLYCHEKFRFCRGIEGIERQEAQAVRELLRNRRE